MLRRASCAEFAELRSAYVDGALAHRDRERLLRHLVECAACRGDVEELRRVRRLLARPAQPPLAPEELANRLLSIPARPDTAGPRPARRRSRRVATAVLSVALLLTVLGGVGYAAAPPTAATPQTAAMVADPTGEAVSEFRSAVATLPFLSAAASAVAGVPTTPRTQTSAPRALDSTARPFRDQTVLRGLLSRAARAGDTVNYRGTLSYLAVDRDHQIVARIEALHLAGQGLRLAAFDPAGRGFGTTFYPAVADARISDQSVVELLARHYHLAGWSQVRFAGRPAVAVEARTAENRPVARWWLDRGTGLVVWQETYDSTGALAIATGFTSLQVVSDRSFLGHFPPTVVPATTASLTLSRATELATGGWVCREELAGLSLVRLRSDTATSPGMVHLVYSDGVSRLSVVEQRGRLARQPAGTKRDPATGAYVRDGSPAAATWQSGDTVFTVVTDASGQALADAVAALPRDGLPPASTMDRVRAGWARILGAS